MEAKKWAYKIRNMMKEADIYNPTFEITIRLLSETLELRDDVRTQFLEAIVYFFFIHIEYISDRGSTNKKLNPLIKQQEDLTALALTYINALGLSTAAFKKIKGEDENKKDTLTELLNKLE